MLRGELDFTTQSSLHETLSKVDGPVCLDLSHVRYLDSSALSELAILARRIAPARAIVSGTQPQVKRVFKLVGFDTIFIFDRRARDGNATAS